MAKDADYIKLIHTARWVKLRHTVLTEHPLCQRCEADGKIVSAVEVHHIQPVEYGMTHGDKKALMFDEGNLIALCHACHVAIHKEMGRSGRAATERHNKALLQRAIERFFPSSADKNNDINISKI
jgi:5-methylcytosine-specific restriction protein A